MHVYTQCMCIRTGRKTSTSVTSNLDVRVCAFPFFSLPLLLFSFPLCVCVCVCVQVQGRDVKELSALALSGMSARERNRAKRKAKQMARRNSRESDTPERA